MSRRKSNHSELPPDGLFERTVGLAKKLGIDWSGAGAGIYLYEQDAQEPVWRIYSDWAGTGAIVDVDVTTGLVRHVQDQAFEAVDNQLAMPTELRPTEEQVLEFLRERMETLAWSWPDRFSATWDDDEDVWRVSSHGAAPREEVVAVVRGKRGALRLARLSRV